MDEQIPLSITFLLNLDREQYEKDREPYVKVTLKEVIDHMDLVLQLKLAKALSFADAMRLQSSLGVELLFLVALS